MDKVYYLNCWQRNLTMESVTCIADTYETLHWKNVIKLLIYMTPCRWKSVISELYYETLLRKKYGIFLNYWCISDLALEKVCIKKLTWKLALEKEDSLIVTNMRPCIRKNVFWNIDRRPCIGKRFNLTYWDHSWKLYSPEWTINGFKWTITLAVNGLD